MNKNVKIMCFWLLGCVVTCEARNYFGGKMNQVSIYVGQEFTGTRRESPKIEPLCGGHIVYSQPNTFFRLQGRQNFELLCFFAYDNKYKKYNRFTAGLSQDVIIQLLNKIFFGFEIVELFVRHFSNGDLTPENEGYNFFGIAMMHNF